MSGDVGGNLERAVRDCEALAKISPENPEYMAELGSQKYAQIGGYYASTGELTTEARASAASLGIKAADEAKAIAATPTGDFMLVYPL